MTAEAQDTVSRVQARVQAMQETVQQWQGQYGGLQSQDLGRMMLDAGHSGGCLGRCLSRGWPRMER